MTLKFFCVVQWRTLWFSAPTSLNNDLLNHGEIVGKYHETINWAFQTVLGLSYFEMEYVKDLFPEDNGKVLGEMPERV